jgi:predicted methyltransferase
MYSHSSKLVAVLAAGATLLIGACATSGSSQPSNAWTNEALAAALSVPTRPQGDRDRDADRKPAQLMTTLGVERGMTALDVMASGGYMTEVLSVAVGPTGKVHAQNALAVLQFNNGAYAKQIGARLEGNRLPNVARLDGDVTALPPGSVDVAVTAMNLHDIYNRGAQGPQAAQAFVKSVYDALKPGGVFGVVDHVGNPGADNARLHRMTKQQAIDVAKAVGFVVEAESDLYSHPQDDHTKGPFDPALRGKTDQFTLKLRKPK